MRARILSETIDDPDIPGLPGREDYEPKHPTDFYALVSLRIGLEGERGDDMLRFELATPSYIQRKLREGPPMLVGRHWIIVDSYNKESIFRFLTEYIEDTDVDGWEGLWSRLSKIGQWVDHDSVVDDHDYQFVIKNAAEAETP